MSKAELQPKCKACNITFSQRKNLLRHNRSFHEERKFDIKVCTKSEQTSRHEIDSSESSTRPVVKKNSFACPICCGKSFPSREALKLHLLQTIETLKCPECAEHFDSAQKLAIHLELPCKGTISSYQVIASVALNTESCNSTEELVRVSDSQMMGSEDEDQNAGVEYNLSEEKEQEPNQMASDSVEMEQPEWEEDGETHFCTSCNIHISSVVEHVEKFHPHQTIYYETGAIVDEDEEAANNSEINIEEYVDEKDHVEDQEYFEEEYLDNDEQSDPDTSASSDILQSAASSRGVYPVTLPKAQSKNVILPTSAALPSKRTLTIPSSTRAAALPSKRTLTIPSSTRAAALPSKRTLTIPSSTIRLPKIIGTLGKTNEVDPKSGVKYVRKVMKIEKFWEDDSFQLPQLQDDEIENDAEEEGPKVVKRKRSSKNARKVVNLQVNKKMMKVKSHLERLVQVGSGDVTIKAEPNTIDDVNTDPGESASQDTVEDDYDPDKEAREAIIKILQDDSSEEMSLIYVCQKCGVEFNSMNCVKSHKCRIRKSPAKLTCEVCGLKCKSQRRLQSHVNTHDPFYKEKLLMKRLEKKVSSDPIICDICNTQFTTEVGHRMHMKMHRPDNIQKVAEMNNKVEYRCDLCQMTCYSARTLGIHYKVHFPFGRPSPDEIKRVAAKRNDQSVLACKLCFMTFEDNASLKEHWQTHEAADVVEEETITGDIAVEETVISIQMDHQQVEDECFTCEECGKLMYESYREMHEKMHRGELFYVCGTCNRKFPCQEHLDLHMRIHEVKVELKCGQCEMTFSDQALLAAHISKHSAIERPYPCGFCGKCFSRPHEKVKHERVHTGEQPYECSICGMRFRVAYCLRMHERIHTGIRPYGCEFCDKTFRTRSGYKQHVSIHSDLRQFHCKVCPKTFKTIVQLAGHRKSHTKPYVCAECNRRFATSYMLRSHMANHANEQTSSLKHKCPDCGASYGREYALRDHMKSSHNKVMPYPPKRKAVQAEFEASSNDSSQEAVYLAIE